MFYSSTALFCLICVLTLGANVSWAQTKATPPDIVLAPSPSFGSVAVPDIVLAPSPSFGSVAVPDIVLVPSPSFGSVAVPDMVLVPLPPVGSVAVPEIVLVPVSPPDRLVIRMPEIILVTGDDANEALADIDAIGSGIEDTSDESTELYDNPTQEESSEGQRAWCGGRYSAQLSKPRILPAGPPIGRTETATAQISSTECTKTMHIEVSGMSLALTRTESGEHVGSMIGDGGQNVTFFLTCNAGFGIIGYLEAQDANIRIQRDIEMTRTTGEGPDLSACPPEIGFEISP